MTKGDTKAPKWPKVEEQLAASNVVRGSALEKLIRDNQDTQMLRSDESNDDVVDLPLWFRVYWRKQHPHEQQSTSPSGDYPDVANQVCKWMILNQDLPPEPSLWYPTKGKQDDK